MRKGLDIFRLLGIIEKVVTGCGADGSALRWGRRGRGFKSRHSDQAEYPFWDAPYFLCKFDRVVHDWE